MSWIKLRKINILYLIFLIQSDVQGQTLCAQATLFRQQHLGGIFRCYQTRGFSHNDTLNKTCVAPSNSLLLIVNCKTISGGKITLWLKCLQLYNEDFIVRSHKPKGLGTTV